MMTLPRLFWSALGWQALPEAGGLGLLIVYSPARLEGQVTAFLAAWLMIALRLWVNVRWPSFVLAMGVGIVATVAGVLVIQSDWAAYCPWILPAVVSLNLRAGAPMTMPVAMGVAGGFIMSVVGAWEVSRRDVLSGAAPAKSARIKDNHVTKLPERSQPWLTQKAFMHATFSNWAKRPPGKTSVTSNSPHS